MTPLDRLIDEWIRTLGSSEPALAPHLDEIADHVRSDAQARVSAGVDVPEAFAAAIGTFGAPRDLAEEFLKNGPDEQRLAIRLTAMYVAASLLLTAAIVGVDKLVIPLNPTWTAFVLLFLLNPLLIVPFAMRYLKVRRRPHPA